MWTRKELKDKAKFSLNKNYWKTVLVAAIISVLLAGGSGISFSNSNYKDLIDKLQNNTSSVSDDNWELDTDGNDYNLNKMVGPGSLGSLADELENYEDGESYDSNDEYGEDDFFENFEKNKYNLYKNSGIDSEGIVAVLAIAAIFIIIFAVIILAISIVMDIFIINPLQLGVYRFSLQNLNAPANVGEVGYGFDCNYKNNYKTLFLKDLYTVLWTLLFIIPGIVKSYEYRMIPYLLAENPQMTADQAFAESKAMMTGNKWNAFVLDLSFIGWHILSAFTVGLLSIFYVAPYQMMTNAALYEKLRYGMPQVQMPQEQMPQVQMPQE